MTIIFSARKIGGSELAREGGLNIRRIFSVWNAAFVSKLTPTVVLRNDHYLQRTQNLWERACSRRGLNIRRIFRVWNAAFVSKLTPTMSRVVR
ncbi:hypothetical protein ABEH28_00300 [Pseudomonas sp. Ps21-P2]|uniref:hypothetical protein n=1 Tax=Pseudomonas sp. Ps21-P2 TaxID=3080331 RepID=UPI0032084AEE